jgi:hypothetical protein
MMRSLQRRFSGVRVAIRSHGGNLQIGKFRIDLMGDGSAFFYCARTAHLAISVQFLNVMGFRGTPDDGKSVEIPTFI